MRGRAVLYRWKLTIFAGGEIDPPVGKIDDVSCGEDVAVDVIAEFLGEGKKPEWKVLCGIHVYSMCSGYGLSAMIWLQYMCAEQGR